MKKKKRRPLTLSEQIQKWLLPIRRIMGNANSHHGTTLVPRHIKNSKTKKILFTVENDEQARWVWLAIPRKFVVIRNLDTNDGLYRNDCFRVSCIVEEDYGDVTLTVEKNAFGKLGSYVVPREQVVDKIQELFQEQTDRLEEGR